jgi:hypothetical protein
MRLIFLSSLTPSTCVHIYWSFDMEYVDVAIAICTSLGMSVVQIFVSCSWLYWMIFLWYCLVRPGNFRDGSLPPVGRGSIRTNSFTHSLFNLAVHLFIIPLYVLRRIHLLIHYSIHSFVHSFILLSMYYAEFIYSFIIQFIHSFIHHSLVCITPNSFTHSLFNPFIHAFIIP